MPSSADPVPGPQDRQRLLENLTSTTYDVAVVGGGIAGAGVARDAAMRGLDVLLVEQRDFASGTTAGSTRLIHGGLRYLEQFEFGLVFESLQERETLAAIAPHLVEPLAFLIPQYDATLPERLKLRAGMWLYDLLSYGKSMPTHEHLDAAELADLEPGLPTSGLQGGFVYHDRRAPFVERLCVENVLDAAAHGADVLNHAAATAVSTDDDRVGGIEVEDALSGATVEVTSDAVVNAAGPWVDGLLDGSGLVRPTKGIHLVLPRLTDHALTLPTTDDRIIFVVPWNDVSLVGTTDTDYAGDPAEATAEAADVEYLLAEAGRYFPGLDEGDVHYAYAGVRPLADPGTAKDASAVSRRHRIVEHGGRHTGLFSLVGAKITPYRHAAEELTDSVAAYIGVDAPSRTDTTPLPGARGDAAIESALPDAVLSHLVGLYGTRVTGVIERAEGDERLAEHLCPHSDDVLAQVVVAVEEEYARTVPDVMLRRCTVGHEPCQGADAVAAVAALMGELLDWDRDRRREEIERYRAIVDRRQVSPADDPPGTTPE